MKYWGYSQFRPMQEEIILSVLEKRDTLALLPTGGGKSLTYQLPALANEGLCIVVSPLIALMIDQIENLKKKGIKALAVYSGMTREEIDIALDNCIYGDFKFLYCSPERIGTEIFRSRVEKMKVNLIAVDEAHCISQWGYDFRPSYLKIVELREILPVTPVLALTATATPDVIDDIMEQLKFKEKNVLRKSFERKNLVYVVRQDDNKPEQLLNILKSVKGSGIVYVRQRNKTKEISDFLNKNNIKSDFYHAGLTTEIRNMKQDAWMRDKIRIMVCTNAFGMGIDKPDVRTVIHYDIPDSPEAYFQEAGRAGRDEKKSYAVLIYNENDKISINKRIELNFPDIQIIKQVYNALGNYLQVPYGAGKNIAFDFNIYSFASAYKLNVQIVYSSLKILEQEGYIELSDEINNPAKIHFLVNRDDLYRFQVANTTFDAFIKLLLRSYEGLFTNYVNIDESLLAKRAGTTIDNVYKYLNKLSSAKIIHYIPRKNTPVIVYLEERLDDRAVHIPFSHYQQRKETYVKKSEAMLEYATAQNKCRQQILLHYFGEKDYFRCGQCDICLKRNELELSQYEFDLIVKDIKNILHSSTVNFDTLINNCKNSTSHEKIIKVVRWLLDNGKIIEDEGKLLKWHN